MDLLVADYVCIAVTVLFCVLGVFRGFSGSLAFFVACGAAGTAALFLWPHTLTVTGVLWLRGVGVALAALLMFGIVRITVKKTVKKLLDQPADSLFGLVLGVVISALLLAGWAYSGIYLEYSVLVRRFAAVLPAV